MKKNLTVSASALVLLLSATPIFAADIVDTAVSAGSFKTFVAAAQAAGLKLAGESLHHATVKGRAESVALYALNKVPEIAT